MNQFIVKIINDSKWLYPKSIDFLEIDNDTPRHIAMERIWLNVSVSFGVRWQDILASREDDTKLYSYKIIINILIYNALEEVYLLDESEILNYLGYDNKYMIEEYFDYIKSKN
jgi:hypothetical protein